MDQAWVTVLVSLVGGTGLGGAIASIYSARVSARTGQSGNEVEASKAATADWEAFTKQIRELMKGQDRKISDLEAKVQHLEADRAIDATWIDLLQEHIWLGKQPPPPPRPINPN